MGCHFSKFYLSDSDAYKNINSQLALINDPKDIFHYLRQKFKQDFECIFILGGIGSKKGEFIYELLQTSFEEKIDQGPKIYIDIEELILKNIKNRIGQISLTGNQLDIEDTLSYNDKKDFNVNFLNNLNLLKEKFEHVINLINNHWILQLIENELKSNSDQKGLKFIINLIPNQINLFQKCLYFKNGPNFSTFNHTFIAINLIRNDQKQKDLDLVFDYQVYEKINQSFVKYFRNLNRLINLKVTKKQKNIEPRIKLSRSSKAIKVENINHLENLIRSNPNNFLELDISNFRFQDKTVSKGPIVFLVNGSLNLGNEVILIDSSENDLKAVHKFANAYQQIILTHCNTFFL